MSEAAAGLLLFAFCALTFAGSNAIASRSMKRERVKFWVIVALLSAAISAGLFFYQK